MTKQRRSLLDRRSTYKRAGGTALVVLAIVVLTLIGGFFSLKALYDPIVGAYTYSASPKLGGVTFPPLGFTLSTASQRQVNHIVEKYGLVGATLTLTDFEKNERPVIWWVINRDKFPAFYDIFKATQDNRNSTQERGFAIFSKDEVLNRVISRLLDGQHVCEPVNITLLARRYKDANKHVARVCYASIPPYGGAMTGYLAFFLPKEMDAATLQAFRASMIEVQLDIFSRDVRKINVPNELTDDLSMIPAPSSETLPIIR